jgi:SAM-dependent methyltransferase
VTKKPTEAGRPGHFPGYDPATYGDSLAACYDSLYPADHIETDQAINLLEELARDRPGRSLLEFGIGTGRLAIELERRGIRIGGIDASERMVAALRAKAPSADIRVVIGDYVSARMPGQFSVVAIVLNNIFDPRGLSAQLALFANAARHLEPEGYFVVEAFVLDDSTRDGGWTVVPRFVGADHVELQLMRFDIETGTIERTLVHLRSDGPKFITVRDHYAAPEELDVMAHVNGLRRVARYADWSRQPFTARCRRHISVYQRR